MSYNGERGAKKSLLIFCPSEAVASFAYNH